MAYGHESYCPHPGDPCVCGKTSDAAQRVGRIDLPPVAQGCICPPGANMTCRNPLCPRGGSGEPMKIT